jgi:hypothetical protein
MSINGMSKQLNIIRDKMNEIGYNMEQNVANMKFEKDKWFINKQSYNVIFVVLLFIGLIIILNLFR